MKLSFFFIATATLFYSLNVLAKVEPSTLSFEATTVGQSSPPQQVSVTNPGGGKESGPIDINVELTGDHSNDFSHEHTCPASLEVGANCTVTVTFSPTATGERTATLSAGNKVTLTGTGTGGEGPAASPSMPAINKVSSVDETSGSITDSTAQFSGGISVNAGEFELTKGNVKSLTDSITVSGIIIPEPAHQGKAADIIVVGLYTVEPNETCDPQTGDYYMNTQSENKYCNWIVEGVEVGKVCNPSSAEKVRSHREGERNYWQRWQGNLKGLVPLYYIESLSEQEMLTEEAGRVLYRDKPAYRGDVCINFGYRLHDPSCSGGKDNVGADCCKLSDKSCTIVFNEEPLRFSVVSNQSSEKK